MTRSMDVESISESVGIRKELCGEGRGCILHERTSVQINQLGRIKGLGIKTIEKVFQLSQPTSKFFRPDST